MASVTSRQIKEQRLQFINTLLFETPGGIRYTQDSPVLPNVWLAFALEPRKQQELILTTANEGGTGKAAGELRCMLGHLRKKRPSVGRANPKERLPARVAYIPGQMAVKLYFDELMRVVLPLTPWWHETYDRLRRIEKRHRKEDKRKDDENSSDPRAGPADWFHFPQPDKTGKREKDFLEALLLMRREIDPSVEPGSGKTSRNPAKRDGRIDYIRQIPSDLSWLIRISGVIADALEKDAEILGKKGSVSYLLNEDFEARKNDGIENFTERESRIRDRALSEKKAKNNRLCIVRAFMNLYENWCPDNDYPTDRLIWRVTKNRRVHLAVAKSSLTVKADAARRLFDISSKHITWAILDSGIDGTHPAFKLTTEEHERETRKRLAEKESKPASEVSSSKQSESDAEAETETPIRSIDKSDGTSAGEELASKFYVRDLTRSRVVKTLDFTKLRDMLDYDIEPHNDETNARRIRFEREIESRIAGFGEKKQSDARVRAKSLVEDLRRRIKAGKDISWQDLEDAIVVNDPSIPSNDHGTHVAGILGADWIEDLETESELPLAMRTRVMQGVCPDINLIDVRVFREDGLTDEFELLAAIQFLRWMNSRAGTMQVHGANLSLSLIHEVRRFACGQTPICDECNEASALGMVIVAAAGNRGFEMSDIDDIRASDSFRSVSITDPGNADKVITVGATHRKRPHEYGVSYFSSRGPTGDGRLKPDLVAPGEKIRGPTPNGRAEFKDGTSMAAPHVSGAAAMLMSRHGELIGQPERIKSILCETATDLGRERYFQGHGLLDILRALQSV